MCGMPPHKTRDPAWGNVVWSSRGTWREPRNCKPLLIKEKAGEEASQTSKGSSAQGETEMRAGHPEHTMDFEQTMRPTTGPTHKHPQGKRHQIERDHTLECQGRQGAVTEETTSSLTMRLHQPQSSPRLRTSWGGRGYLRAKRSRIISK